MASGKLLNRRDTETQRREEVRENKTFSHREKVATNSPDERRPALRRKCARLPLILSASLRLCG